MSTLSAKKLLEAAKKKSSLRRAPAAAASTATPRISVLVPAYNAVATLGATLSGLLTADYPDLEVLVIDDGSTDATGELAGLYAREWPEGNPSGRFVKVLTRENGGIAQARNTGLEVATGDFIALVDGDDVPMPDYFITTMEAFRAAGGDPGFYDPRFSKKIVVNNAWLLTPAGINPGRILLRETLPAPEEQRTAILRDNVGGILSVFPKQLIEEIGGFDPDLRVCEDWDLWIRAVLSGWVLVRQDRPTALYRWTGGSASSQRETMYAAQDYVLRKAYEAGGLRPEEKAQLERRLAAGSPGRMVSQAETALRTGDLDEAGKLLRRASELLPHQKRIKAKAWATRVPGGARLMARRQQQIDERVGFTEAMQR